jgi:hypothetical protein
VEFTERAELGGDDMADKKVIFIAFAIEDESQRNLLKGQSLNTASPFEYVDMSVKEPYDTGWKDRVRARILRSDGVIALVSKSTLNSSGEKWEINCAKEEHKKMIGIWAYSNETTKPPALDGYRIIPWTWPRIASFIDSL